MNRRLYRCRHDKRVAGVAAGVAEYFEVDPTLVRIFWVLSVFVGGMGLLLYIAMAIIVPLEPESGFVASGSAAGAQPGAPAADATAEGTVASPTDWHVAPAGHQHATRGNGRATTWFGIVLMLFGALALVDVLLPAWADGGRFLWPAFIVGIGALLVASAMRREPTEL
ncbi:MAG TPA: PspC domain-containing protein [Candidatus Limnocylindrales bacterium]